VCSFGIPFLILSVRMQLMRAISTNPKDKTEVSLIFANITQADILLRKELDEFAKNPRFKVFYVLQTVRSECAHVALLWADCMLLFIHCSPRKDGLVALGS